MRRVFVGLLMVVLVPSLSTAQLRAGRAAADTARLHRTLDSLAATHEGQIAYAVLNVDTGERLALRGDDPFPTASLIKVSVLVTLYDMVEKGEISLDDRIRVNKVDKVPGSGMLQFLHDGVEITTGDAAWLMMTVSDNTATNLVLDKVAMRRVWTKMEALGLPRTKVHSRSFQRFTSVAMDSSVKYGLGVTTANEMARLFALLADGKAVSPVADSLMLRMMEHNGNNELLARFAAGVTVAHKDGAGDQVRTNCGLFRLQSRVAVCVLTNENADRRWLIDNDAQVVIARMGEAVAGAWPRAATPRD
jgi:beta-lactamase class A